MTDPVLKLQNDVNRADEARRMLDSDLLKGAFSGLEDAYMAAWRATTIDDVTGREKLFLAINVVGKVRDHLTAIVSNGSVAEAEIKDLRETAERKKRFGII
jgi:hypothetical protein